MYIVYLKNERSIEYFIPWRPKYFSKAQERGSLHDNVTLNPKVIFGGTQNIF